MNRAFAPMAREQKFDVSEMAIVTYLLAKAYNKPIVLLPAVMFSRFQHNTMVYSKENGKITVQDLPKKRLAVRSYTQTTGVWIRGIVQNDYGVDLNKASWTVQESAHVSEYSGSAGTAPHLDGARPPEDAARRRSRFGDLRRGSAGRPSPRDGDRESAGRSQEVVRQAQMRADQPHGRA